MSAALALVANALERLAIRVENTFNADATEGADAPPDGDALMEYARQCFEVLNDPTVAAAMLDEQRQDADAESRGAVKALRNLEAEIRLGEAQTRPEPAAAGMRAAADMLRARAAAIESGQVAP